MWHLPGYTLIPLRFLREPKGRVNPSCHRPCYRKIYYCGREPVAGLKGLYNLTCASCNGAFAPGCSRIPCRLLQIKGAPIRHRFGVIGTLCVTPTLESDAAVLAGGNLPPSTKRSSITGSN